MKIRLGFVSNSSSETFICAMCGYETYMYDWDAYDSNDGPFVKCEHNHIICKDHLRVPVSEILHSMNKDAADLDNIPQWACPVCMLLSGSQKDCCECEYFKEHMEKMLREE